MKPLLKDLNESWKFENKDDIQRIISCIEFKMKFTPNVKVQEKLVKLTTFLNSKISGKGLAGQDTPDQAARRSEEELLVVQGMPLLARMSNAYRDWANCAEPHGRFGILQTELVTVDKRMRSPFKHPNGRVRFAKFLKLLSFLSLFLLTCDPFLDLRNIIKINS